MSEVLKKASVHVAAEINNQMKRLEGFKKQSTDKLDSGSLTPEEIRKVHEELRQIDDLIAKLKYNL